MPCQDTSGAASSSGRGSRALQSNTNVDFKQPFLDIDLEQGGSLPAKDSRAIGLMENDDGEKEYERREEGERRGFIIKTTAIFICVAGALSALAVCISGSTTSASGTLEFNSVFQMAGDIMGVCEKHGIWTGGNDDSFGVVQNLWKLPGLPRRFAESIALYPLARKRRRVGDFSVSDEVKRFRGDFGDSDFSRTNPTFWKDMPESYGTTVCERTMFVLAPDEGQEDLGEYSYPSHTIRYIPFQVQLDDGSTCWTFGLLWQKDKDKPRKIILYFHPNAAYAEESLFRELSSGIFQLLNCDIFVVEVPHYAPPVDILSIPECSNMDANGFPNECVQVCAEKAAEAAYRVLTNEPKSEETFSRGTIGGSGLGLRKSDIIIWGISIGSLSAGHLAAAVASPSCCQVGSFPSCCVPSYQVDETEEHLPYAGVILVSPLSCLELTSNGFLSSLGTHTGSMLETVNAVFGWFRWICRWKPPLNYIDNPWSTPKAWSQVRPCVLDFVKNYEHIQKVPKGVPVLLFHCRGDQMVSHRNSKHLFGCSSLCSAESATPALLIRKQLEKENVVRLQEPERVLTYVSGEHFPNSHILSFYHDREAMVQWQQTFGGFDVNQKKFEGLMAKEEEKRMAQRAEEQQNEGLGFYGINECDEMTVTCPSSTDMRLLGS